MCNVTLHQIMKKPLEHALVSIYGLVAAANSRATRKLRHSRVASPITMQWPARVAELGRRRALKRRCSQERELHQICRSQMDATAGSGASEAWLMSKAVDVDIARVRVDLTSAIKAWL